MSHKIYFTPGPSQLFFTIADHIKNALKEDVGSISHRSTDFKKIYQETQENLFELLNIPTGYKLVFTSSANEIWERIIQNLTAHSSHHFVNGAFSKKFLSFSEDYNRLATHTSVEDGHVFPDFTVPEEAELISLTLNETSIGYQTSLDEIETVRHNYPSKILTLDAVSALPAIPINLNSVDSTYFSVQKCFGLPSGLGVWIVNEKCIEKAESLTNDHVTGSYHKLTEMINMGDNFQTPETPNTLAIYLLGKIAKDMLLRGKKSIINDTVYKSSILYASIEKSSLKPFITDQKHRSKTVIVIDAGSKTDTIIKAAAEKGWIIGSGYGKYKSSHLRIANFPTHSKEQMEQLCDFIEQY